MDRGTRLGLIKMFSIFFTNQNLDLHGFASFLLLISLPLSMLKFIHIFSQYNTNSLKVTISLYHPC